WVELTGCDLDYESAIHLHTSSSNADKGTFIPVRPAGYTGAAALMLKVETESIGRRVDAELESLGKGHEAALGRNRTLTGMVDNGMFNDSKARTALRQSMTGGSLRQNFVMLEEGA